MCVCTTTTTTTTTLLAYDVQCECWDTTQVGGPTCSELTAKAECNDNGVLDAAQKCICSSEDVGLGPNCNERLLSASSRCNGKGVPNSNGGCDCFSGALGEGPTCTEYTNAITCNNLGDVQSDGSCVCYDPAVGTGPTCVEYNNGLTCGVKGRNGDEKGIATPDGGCFWLCDVYYGGGSRCEFDDDDDTPTVCGKCEGDCDTDNDCLPGLLCLNRDSDDDGYQDLTATFTNSMGVQISESVKANVRDSLPGCFARRDGKQISNNRRVDEDFCYDPRDVVVHNHQMSYEDHCSQGAGKRKGPVIGAVIGILAAVIILVWWFCVDCYPAIIASVREKARLKALKRVFGRTNPIICKALDGEAYTITDWSFCNDLEEALLRQNPKLEVEKGMVISLVHPEYGKVGCKRGTWRDEMLDSTISVDNIALIFEQKATATASARVPSLTTPTHVGSADRDYQAATTYQQVGAIDVANNVIVNRTSSTAFENPAYAMQPQHQNLQSDILLNMNEQRRASSTHADLEAESVL